jgi:hypothetical protein
MKADKKLKMKNAMTAARTVGFGGSKLSIRSECYQPSSAGCDEINSVRKFRERGKQTQQAGRLISRRRHG